jgi:hypothetical protein
MLFNGNVFTRQTTQNKSDFFNLSKLQNKIIIIPRSQYLVRTPYAKIKCTNQMIYNKQNNTILVVLERIHYGSLESIDMKEAYKLLVENKCIQIRIHKKEDYGLIL